jgi:hypothetical protein
MYHYLFTNDLRISNLDSFLTDAGICFKNNSVPSAKEDKNANNNMNTLGFYFNLTQNSKCTLECAQGNTRKVVLNFIKKFQFPNPRTSSSLIEAVNDNIQIAPMRIIIQTLYIMGILAPNNAYLFKNEIAEHIFFNDAIAKNKNPDILNLAKTIISNNKRTDISIPEDEVLKQKNIHWNQCKRQIREMVKVLCWSGCVEEKNGAIVIKHNNLSRDNEADLFEIITYNDFWHYDSTMTEAENKQSYQLYMDIDSSASTVPSVSLPPLNFKTNVSSDFKCNRIIFGAPGTGKSYSLNKEREELLGNNKELDYERVTFHPDYSYANFVGTYKPVMVDCPTDSNSAKTSDIAYKYVPGPFMRTYVKALINAQTDNHRPFLLIIEEINRANVAAVFGDIFQLLDRNDDNISEYPIQASEDIKNYLAEKFKRDPKDFNQIRIPNNLFIWATMNSADQGVFPMDTAFKRRWDFTYLGIDDNDSQIQGKFVYLGKNKDQKVEWNRLRKAINDFLAQLGINEDKQLGPYFISKNVISAQNNIIDRDKFCEVFKHKVIMYLFEDAAKQKRATVFSEIDKENLRYSKICEAFDKKGILIFNKDIQNNTGYTTESEPETQNGVLEEW